MQALFGRVMKLPLEMISRIKIFLIDSSAEKLIIFLTLKDFKDLTVFPHLNRELIWVSKAFSTFFYVKASKVSFLYGFPFSNISRHNFLSRESPVEVCWCSNFRVCNIGKLLTLRAAYVHQQSLREKNHAFPSESRECSFYYSTCSLLYVAVKLRKGISHSLSTKEKHKNS